MHPHERLEAWRCCRRLTVAIYDITRSWPKHELFGLTSQIRRAAVSAETNIAEGVAKRGPKELRRYLDISLGSLAELTSLLSLSKELRYVDEERWSTLEPLRESASKLTWLLYRSVSRVR